MTAQADLIRGKRRAFAAPGGFHDRLIAFLAKALPAAIGIIAAVMILSPLSPRGEISFLLDRNKVAITNDRIKVNEAMYRGQDSQGRPFRVQAGNAVQDVAANPVVKMSDLMATMELSDGSAQLQAPSGSYNYRTEEIQVNGPVKFRAPDGYRMVTSAVAVNLNTRRAVGFGGVEGSVATGSFSAEKIVADLEARTIALEGNARLRMTPGKLRIPK